jgi:hypothetical protein
MPDHTISLSVTDLPWYWWAIVGVMILLQLITLVVITGRPRAVAVIGLVLPVMCGVCAVGGTAMILSWTQDSAADRHQFLPLFYAIWGLCALVALVTVVLCVVPLKCRVLPTARPVDGGESLEGARINP